MATIESLDLAQLINNPQSIAEALEDVLEVSSGNIASLKSTAQTDQEYISDTLKPQAQEDADTLSDLVDDAPTADVLNLDLSITDITSSFSVATNWNVWDTWNMILFNNIVFIQISAYRSTTGMNSNQEIFATISNEDYYSSKKAVFPSITFQGDLASEVIIPSNQTNIYVNDLQNAGDGNYRVNVNGWYYIG